MGRRDPSGRGEAAVNGGTNRNIGGVARPNPAVAARRLLILADSALDLDVCQASRVGCLSIPGTSQIGHALPPVIRGLDPRGFDGAFAVPGAAMPGRPALFKSCPGYRCVRGRTATR